jgi:hypothetical protein
MSIEHRLSRLEQSRQPADDRRCRCPFSLARVYAEIDRGFRDGGSGPESCPDCGGAAPYPITWVSSEPEGRAPARPVTP